ncbi:hypothetical protein PHYBOEH_008924 [Phytophthora boehmeriae]|uniref:Uncharacterized protein n=1 Tax=Phytophthora boehmeriae TaxID=109152 RepID=A0A8T1X7B6_9STRA|nr:hypothetical protein PHYBOEH_008924 [Phytophthora boehmeriae]
MASMNSYTSSLRNDRPVAKPYEEGVPFFVPQLSKVKTSVMCQQGKSQKLLFKYETEGLSTINNPQSPSSLPYRKQGNCSYYTEENLEKRKKLMENPHILKAIERYWETFPCIRQGGDTISMHDYVDVFVKFYKALVSPSEFSIGEARFIVEKDWARDAIDEQNMSKMLFFSALFEVADIWTLDISAEEYLAFLEKLFDRVTMVIYDHAKLQWITAFAELERIRSFEDPNDVDEEDSDIQYYEANKKVSPLESASGGPRPPLVRRRTRSAKELLPSVDTDHRLPAIHSGRKAPKNDEDNEDSEDNDSWGTDFSYYGDTRDHLFERKPTKTRLEQILEAKRLGDDDGHKSSQKPRPSRPMLPDLPSQQVHLSIPSIYINPDLTHAHDAERAARRRLRKNVRLVQRLRRITF